MGLPEPGTVVEVRRTFTQAEFDRFAALTGDRNPIHVDDDYSARTRFGRTVAHGMMLYGVVAGAASAAFPGAVQGEQSLVFPAPTYAGDEMTIRLTVLATGGQEVRVASEIVDSAGRPTCTGEMTLRWEAQW
jgi:acyl dehydratase